MFYQVHHYISEPLFKTARFSSRWVSFCGALLILTLSSSALHAQKKYQGLLWEISGNGMEEPSYLYGTMHVSDKVAFYLGEPFFEALESVDQVALELEPEEWFNQVLGGDMMSSTFRFIGNSGQFGSSSAWNEFDGRTALPENTNLTIQNIFRNSPMMINQLLFRFYDPSGNFEEETWLDMYIYQSAMKMGKSTLGLETFDESMAMMEKAQEAMSKNPRRYSDLDYNSQIEAQSEIEDAYRKGDLDMLDSLTTRLNDKAFTKYILIERNKNFIAGMDSLMRKAPLFTGVGAAHLPGEEGCIEMLRKLGYTVSPMRMGLRDAKKKKKLSETFIKRPLNDFTSKDGVISFNSPSEVYELTLDPKATSYITMDIANGLTFMVDRFISRNILDQRSLSYQVQSLDSMLFEVIPGDILEKKEVEQDGSSGFDIMHEVGRGDINRSRILFSEHEVVIARLSGTGAKIDKGAGDHFFTSLKFKKDSDTDSPWREYGLPDNSLSINMPGLWTDYARVSPFVMNGDLFVQASDQDGDLFMIHRLHHFQHSFIEEEKYILDKVESAFAQDHEPIELKRTYSEFDGHLSLKVDYGPDPHRRVSAQYIIVGNSVYVIHCHSNRDAKIERFMNSLSIEVEQFENYYSFTDSLAFVRSKIPWERDESDIADLLGLNFAEKSEEQEIYSYTHRVELNPPGSTSPLILEYQRYPRYAFYESTEKFEQEFQEKLSANEDLFIEESEFIWGRNEFTADHLLSDSLSNYRYAVHSELKGNAVLSIYTGFDSEIGPSPLYETLIENLEILEDENTHDYLFDNKGELFLKDLVSADSTYFNIANDRLYTIHSFQDKVKWSIVSTLKENCSPLANAEDKEEYLSLYNRFRYLDTSAAMITALKEEYLNSMDSALYQREVLATLIRMHSPESIGVAKELILNEAPIGISYSLYDELFSAILDSLESSSSLFPEILDLVEFEEYKEPILLTLVAMVDSSAIDPMVYTDRVPYLERQARSEWRRSTSTGYEFDSSEDSRFSPRMDVFNYFKLLTKHRDNPEVAALFARAEDSDHLDLSKAYVRFISQQGEQIPDSTALSLLMDKPLEDARFLIAIAREDLINDSIDLRQLYIEDQVRKQWRTRSYDWDDSAIDSVQFVLETMDSIRTHSFITYFIKSKRIIDGRSTEEMHVVMVDEKSKFPDLAVLHINDDRSELMSEEEQFDLLRKRLISQNRAWPFHNEEYDMNFGLPEF